MAQKSLVRQMDRIVKVNRVKLLVTLKENREKHIKKFNEAMAGYKDTALQACRATFDKLQGQLHERQLEVEKRIKSFSPETADQFTDHFSIFQGVSIPLQVPRSYEEYYDAAIDMAEFDVRDELELSGAEFQCFCRDVWDWSEGFETTSAMYCR